MTLLMSDFNPNKESDDDDDDDEASECDLNKH